MRKNEEEQSAKLIRFMSSIILGGVLALAVCLVFLFFAPSGSPAVGSATDLWYSARWLAVCWEA